MGGVIGAAGAVGASSHFVLLPLGLPFLRFVTTVGFLVALCPVLLGLPGLRVVVLRVSLTFLEISREIAFLIIVPSSMVIHPVASSATAPLGMVSIALFATLSSVCVAM